MKNYKYLVVLQSIIILVLLAFIIFSYNPFMKKDYYNGLLAPRVYAGILEPKSFLITNYEPLKEELSEYIKTNNINASIYVENLRDGAHMAIDADRKFYPLSLNKVPISILIMQKVENESLSLDMVIPVTQEDKNNIYGNYGDLEYSNNAELSLRELLRRLLSNSDNTALTILTHYIGPEEINLIYEYYPIDLKFYIGNYTDLPVVTPLNLANVFRSLYLSTLLDAEDSEYLLSLMTNTVFDIKSKANLPENVVVSHKFGVNEQRKLFSDCGIFYVNKSRVLYCIMLSNVNPTEGENIVGETLNKIYSYTITQRDKLDRYKNH